MQKNSRPGATFFIQEKLRLHEMGPLNKILPEPKVGYWSEKTNEPNFEPIGQVFPEI